MASNTDISKTRDADWAALAETLVNSIPAMVAYWDKNQRCCFANQAYERWFGVRPDAVVGMTMRDALGPLYPLNLPHIEKALSGEPQEFEREIPDPAGGPARFCQVNYIPHVVEGRVQGFCVLLTNISRRKRAEEALQATQRQLVMRERLAAMATLAAGIAHEINNPLAAVLGNVDLAIDAVEDGTVDTAALRAMLLDARSGAARVREIVQSMRLLARTEAVQRERINVAESIEQSIAFAANTLRYRARLIRDLAPDLFVDGNASQLSQVFVHLLANAVQALPEDTPRRNAIRITARREADQVVIEVADNGRGIQQENQSRIFEPFFSTRDSGEGMMGLGLPISRNVVEDLGGQLSVSSEAGKGSVFRVVLPAAQGAAPSAEPPPASEGTALSAAPPSGFRPRLLIVDDEEAIATILGRVLARDDYDVTAVMTGREAIAAIGQRPFDLILCDLMMVDMTGEDVYREVTRAWPELARRFLFLTGGAFTPRGRQFLASVQAPVLEKPFQMDVVRKLVSARLQATLDDASSPSKGSLAG